MTLDQIKNTIDDAIESSMVTSLCLDNEYDREALAYWIKVCIEHAFFLTEEKEKVVEDE